MTLKRVRKIHGDRIVIEEKNLHDYIKYIRSNNVKKIQINELYYRKEHVDFLEECPEVEDINISSIYIKNIEGLYHMKSLKELGIHIPGVSLDLNKLPELVELDLEWNKNVKGLTSCSNLRVLTLLKYKPKNKNLQEIEGLRHLTSLTLTQSNISSFQGCSSLLNLKRVELNYIRNELDLNELKQAQSLEEVRIENCSKLLNLDFLNELEKSHRERSIGPECKGKA
ncbi:hypothetical protein [Bacillus sp. LL01]|uniref:hypothetical protein n=1 Tax=Bacillus sp. LL01 TaxID=1665556 RepID=UPI00069EE4FA|nr:hypothetical protein [Bacillus sp. LL01]